MPTWGVQRRNHRTMDHKGSPGGVSSEGITASWTTEGAQGCPAQESPHDGPQKEPRWYAAQELPQDGPQREPKWGVQRRYNRKVDHRVLPVGLPEPPSAAEPKWGVQSRNHCKMERRGSPGGVYSAGITARWTTEGAHVGCPAQESPHDGPQREPRWGVQRRNHCKMGHRESPGGVSSARITAR